MTAAADSELDSRRGWLLVIAGFGTLLLVWGTMFTFTVYAGALADEFGLSQLRVSSVFSVATAAFYVMGGTVGVAIARTPLRPVVAGAGVAVGVAVGLLQLVSSYLGLVVAFALIGMAAGTVFIVVISLVPLWFDAYEGRAMGVTLLGNGLGILVLPTIWVWLLARMDIRGAFAVVGGGLAVVMLVSSPAFRRPAGAGRGGEVAVGRDWFRSLLADRGFLIALVGFPWLWGWYFVLSASLVDILASAGIDRAIAAPAFGIIGGISVVARLGSGAVADRVGARRTLLAGVVLAALGVLALLVTDTPLLMYLTLGLFGIGLGAIATLFSPVLIGRFGATSATAVVGLFTISEAVSAFGSPIGLSLLFELTGGYTVPLVLLAGLTLAGAGLFHWGTRPAAGG